MESNNFITNQNSANKTAFSALTLTKENKNISKGSRAPNPENVKGIVTTIESNGSQIK